MRRKNSLPILSKKINLRFLYLSEMIKKDYPIRLLVIPFLLCNIFNYSLLKTSNKRLYFEKWGYQQEDEIFSVLKGIEMIMTLPSGLNVSQAKFITF